MEEAFNRIYIVSKMDSNPNMFMHGSSLSYALFKIGLRMLTFQRKIINCYLIFTVGLSKTF